MDKVRTLVVESSLVKNSKWCEENGAMRKGVVDMTVPTLRMTGPEDDWSKKRHRGPQARDYTS